VPLLVLDVPHVWTGWTKNTLMKADEIVITATPELANLRNTKNLVDMLKRLRPNDPPPKLIINQAGVPKRPEISPSDFAEPLGLSPMSVIGFDPLLFGNAANNGRMLGEMDAKNPVVAMINEMAHVLTGRSEIKAKKKAGLGNLLGKFSRSKK
jgi:pilus assembly protein CpaE